MVPIKGYEGRYSITTDGKVWSHQVNRFLKPSIHKQGYHMVLLSSPNLKTRLLTVHRLVAQTYIPNPNNYPEVCHKTEAFPSDDSVDNLFWGTRSMNSHDCVSKGRPKNQSGKILSLDEIREIRSFTIPSFGSKNILYRELAIKYGVKPITIQSIMLRRTWKHVV